MLTLTSNMFLILHAVLTSQSIMQKVRCYKQQVVLLYISNLCNPKKVSYFFQTSFTVLIHYSLDRKFKLRSGYLIFKVCLLTRINIKVSTPKSIVFLVSCSLTATNKISNDLFYTVTVMFQFTVYSRNTAAVLQSFHFIGKILIKTQLQNIPK